MLRLKELRREIDRLVNGNGGGAPDRESLLVAAISDFVVAAADVAPVALLLDDLQWADDGTIRLLHHLARVTRGKPVLLLGTLRDTQLSGDYPLLARTLQELARERLAERLVVRRLSAEDTAAFAAALMDQTPLADDIAAFLYRRTKGVPRFIEGMVRSLGGRPELRQEIGAGAMGRVFAAYDTGTEQEVAAKLMLARREVDLDDLLRFQHEGAVLAKLRHLHIVQIYDSFIDEHASCIIMERLEGQSLGRILRDGPLPLARARDLAQQVADALAYAHTQQIVHRDVKPDNVMVAPGDQVKVTDFGIARILQPDTSLQTIATTDMRLGTSLYMAPEQIQGKTVDGRADIYALGAMLYHMVTGRPPFEGSDALSVAVKHLQEEPPPPSARNPEIPADWDAVILKAMAKDPARRFPSAEAMGQAIAGLSEHPAPSTTSSARSYRFRSAMGALVALLVAAAGFWVHTAMATSHTSTLGARLNTYLADLAAHGGLSGTVLVAGRGRCWTTAMASPTRRSACATAPTPNTPTSPLLPTSLSPS